MTTDRTPPTDDQLRDAWRRSGLERLGISFDAALQDPAIAGSLHGMAKSDRRWAANTLGTGSWRLEKMQHDV